ncbi:MAG: SMC-Scp complex subunit ScpB [Tissierellia bacterium]|nr:SMC-Scp complex subunit ScpB [Tissierellia bacterium]
MNNREYISIIESILYIWAEPIHIDEIAKILDLTKKDTKALVSQLKDECDHYRRGIILNDYDDYIQFSTRPDHDIYISKLVKKKRKKTLSNSAMEVLSIIAYKQPITRVEIDDIRGVKSYSSIETLLAKNLIKEVGRLEKIGRPILYGTTTEFLALFDMSSIKDLPSVEKLETLDEFMIQDEGEANED